MSLLCGPRADLWPFYGFFSKRFSLYILSKGLPFYANLLEQKKAFAHWELTLL